MIETLPAVAPEIVTPLRPSEALRLGRLTRPVRTNGLLMWDSDKACALGAIVEGYGGHGYADVPAVLNEPLTVRCPVTRCWRPATGWVSQGIEHLNDHHHWSDDQIIAWLEGLGL